MRGASLLIAAGLAISTGARAQTSPASPSAVASPSAADLQAAGELAAKQGNFDKAIDDFKKADRLEPRAAHACLIALAYARRNMWPQAEIFRTTCHARATASDPLPSWVAASDKQIDDALRTANLAPVTITVTPPDAAALAEITVSSFAPDESFAPRTIHLPPGIHELVANAPGYEQGHQLLEVKDKQPLQVVISLHKVGEAVPAPTWLNPQTPQNPTPTPTPTATPHPIAAIHASAHPAPRGDSKVPYIVGGAGLAVATVGLVLNVSDFYMGPYNTLQHDPLDTSTTDPSCSMAHCKAWQGAQQTVIGLYAVGAVAVGTAIVLKYTVFKHHADVPGVAFVPTRGGGVLSLGWTR